LNDSPTSLLLHLGSSRGFSLLVPSATDDGWHIFPKRRHVLMLALRGGISEMNGKVRPKI